MAEVPGGLHMREIVVSWRTSFYDDDMQGRVCSSQATCDDAASRATLKQALSTSAQRKEREVPTSGDDDICFHCWGDHRACALDLRSCKVCSNGVGQALGYYILRVIAQDDASQTQQPSGV